SVMRARSRSTVAVMILVVEAIGRRTSAPRSQRTVPVTRSTTMAEGAETVGPDESEGGSGVAEAPGVRAMRRVRATAARVTAPGQRSVNRRCRSGGAQAGFRFGYTSSILQAW